MNTNSTNSGSSTWLNDDLSKLFIRIAVSFLALHGMSKMGGDLTWAKDALNGMGLPSFLWIGIPVAEVLAPLLILLGVFTRLSAVMVFVFMIFTIIIGHPQEVFSLNDKSGALALELNYMFMLGALAVFFGGAGKYVVYKFENGWLR